MSIIVKGATMRTGLSLIGDRHKGLQFSVTSNSESKGISESIPADITARMTFHACISRQAVYLYSRVIELFVFSLRRDSLAS